MDQECVKREAAQAERYVKAAAATVLSACYETLEKDFNFTEHQARKFAAGFTVRFSRMLGGGLS